MEKEFWQNAREIISLFHEYTTWLPANIMGDKLRLQSWVCLLYVELQALKSLKHTFWIVSDFFRENPLRIFFCCL